MSLSCSSVFPDPLPPNEGKIGVKEVALGRRPKDLTKLRVSPDYSRVAFAAEKGGRSVVFVDGKEGQAYDEVLQGPHFSPDSRRIAWTARRGNSAFIVVDGSESKALSDGQGQEA